MVEETELTYTFRQSRGDLTTTTQTFTFTVIGALVLSTPDNQILAAGTAISEVLPEATGGGSLTYTLTGPSGGALPAGLSFDAGTRILSGTPTTVAPAATLTYTVTRSDDSMAMMQTFTVAVFAGTLVLPDPDDRNYTAGTAITDLVLPEVAGGGTLTYALTGPSGGALPAGLSFDAGTRTLSGTPTMVEETELIYMVTRSEGNETVMQTFTVTVIKTLVLPAQDDQRYLVDTAITPPLVLPEVAGGGTLTYTLTGPPGGALPVGLSFDPATRTLSGTPTVVAAATTLTYTVMRSGDSMTETQTFTVTVTNPNAGFADLNKVILPEVARAMTDQTVSAITQRMDQARKGEGSRSMTIAGQSTLAGAASVHGQAIADGSLSLKDVLGNSDFVLPLADDEAGTDNGILSFLTLWGGGSYRNLDGSSGSMNFEGDLFSTHLGVDARPRDDLLTGLAVSWGQSVLDYKGDFKFAGDYKLDLTSIQPYANWEVLAQLDLWVTAGYGWGDLEILDKEQDEALSGEALSDVEAWNVAVGGNMELLQEGPARFRLKSSALLTEMKVEGSADITALKVESSLFRMILEGAYKYALADEAYVEPSLEAGVRYDGGDGETGFGAELGAGFRYTDPVAGLTLESKARTLLGRDNYEEWGISGLILLEQGRNGRGLSFSLSPGYGDTGSGTQKVWQEGLRDETRRDYGARLDTRIGYGMTAPGGRGLLTPYSEMTLGSSDRSYRLGMRWELDALFDLNLIGEHRESNSSTDDHAIMLKVDIQF